MGLFFKDEFDRKVPSDKDLRGSEKTSSKTHENKSSKIEKTLKVEKTIKAEKPSTPKKEPRFSMDDNYYPMKNNRNTSYAYDEESKKTSFGDIIGVIAKIASVISMISLIFGFVSCLSRSKKETRLSENQSQALTETVFLEQRVKFLSQTLYYSREEIVNNVSSENISEDQVNKVIDNLLESKEINFKTNATNRIFILDNFKDKDDDELSSELSELGFTDDEIQYAISAYGTANQQMNSVLESARKSDE